VCARDKRFKDGRHGSGDGNVLVEVSAGQATLGQWAGGGRGRDGRNGCFRMPALQKEVRVLRKCDQLWTVSFASTFGAGEHARTSLYFPVGACLSSSISACLERVKGGIG